MIEHTYLPLLVMIISVPKSWNLSHSSFVSRWQMTSRSSSQLDRSRRSGFLGTDFVSVGEVDLRRPPPLLLGLLDLRLRLQLLSDFPPSDGELTTSIVSWESEVEEGRMSGDSRPIRPLHRIMSSRPPWPPWRSGSESGESRRDREPPRLDSTNFSILKNWNSHTTARKTKTLTSSNSSASTHMTDFSKINGKCILQG